MNFSPKQQLDPWVSVNLSVLWPGLGQCYSRAWAKGLIFAGITCGFLFYAIWSILGRNGNTLTGLLTLGIIGIFYVINVFDAYNTLKSLPRLSLAVYQPKRNRWYAVFLSQILPGFGHLYLQKAIVGGVFLAISTVISLLANDYPVLLPIPPFLWAIACYHVYRITPYRGNAYRWVIMTIMIGLLIIRLIVGYVPIWLNSTFMQFIVPSSSMEPTLQVNDRMFVRAHTNYEPQSGDIIVFNVPEEAIAALDINPDTLFVKRVIGLPGQSVFVTRGTVFIDQQPLPEPYTTGVSNYDWGPAIVPPDSYFVLGDHRNESADSHVWGFLPSSDILGRAYKIYWPPERIQPLTQE